MIIAVDFDGTIVEHRYPEIGEELPFAVSTLKLLANKHNHRLILWTVRHGRLLQEAVDWCKERGLEFYAVNKNFPEEEVDNENGYCKINAELFIDDRNLGGLPDWGKIYSMITEGKSWEEMNNSDNTGNDKQRKKKKGWFW